MPVKKIKPPKEIKTKHDLARWKRENRDEVFDEQAVEAVKKSLREEKEKAK